MLWYWILIVIFGALTTAGLCKERPHDPNH